MKFRSKGIISGSIIAFFILLFTGSLVDLGTLPIFIGILVIYLIAIIIRSQNYIVLDDEGVKQVKCNIFFRKKCIIIPYKDIKDIELVRNNNLSKENIGNHCISSVSGSQMQIGKMFHFNKFKSILKDKIDGKSVNISTSTNDYLGYVDKNSSDYFPLIGSKAMRIEIILAIIGFGYIFSELYMKDFDFKSFKLWPDIYIFIPIIILLIFIGVKLYNSANKRSFVMVGEDSLIIGEYYKSNYNVHKIPYSNIKGIEIDLPGKFLSNLSGISFYIKLKNKKEEKDVSGLRNGNSFIEALKRKGIAVSYVQDDNEL